MQVDDEIARFDWAGIRTYVGYAEMVPHAVRSLVTVTDAKEATRLGTWIERILLSVAGPCEGCTPVATVLVAALPEMTPAGHTVALELLAIIAAAEITGPAHEQIGRVDAGEIRRAVAGGVSHYLAVLRAPDAAAASLYSCVDLMDVLAFHDPDLRPEAIAALEALQTGGRAPDLAVLVRNTLVDLINPANDQP
ncbi:hypothetical protein GCM10010172_73460 [Paractinoplanes ferrugineus]|uniref:Uncharacterized protein n=1 Tax=Paractinoplanes ferrugineus TaxID=113564 RepID=A0A919J2W9_9ACTN|nr:hypothetical protein [Actinoplanes ferrugineus]GIE11499.1 hypothetical protein Afe05nite_33390 [Actinoplanes ferrugineus]